MLELEASEENVVQCKLVHFDKLKVAELKAFIIARHPKYTKLSDVAHLKNPRGGKSMEEATHGVENCISVAFGVRNLKSHLLANMERQEQDVVALSVPLKSRINLYDLNGEDIKPSDILKDQTMVDLLVHVFNPNGKLNTLTDTKLSVEILTKADLLFVLLKARFHTHVKRKVKPCQQSNRCLSWANKNLALVACWMIVASHLKEDISCLDKSKCLLANPCGKNFLVCSNEELNQLGCYLHYNCNEGVWIHSGRATSEGGFGKRLKTHLERESSDRNNDDSHFYHSFPSKMSPRANSCSKERYFEYLTAYVGVGFWVEHPPGCFLKSGWLLIYTKEEEKWISGLNF
jgi:hypothetical protein